MVRTLKALLVVASLIVALQVGNHVGVHHGLCGFKEMECTSTPTGKIDAWWRGTADLPEALQSDGVHGIATTALLRRQCGIAAGWKLGFGARIDVAPFAFGDAIRSAGGCVDASLRANLAHPLLLHGELVDTTLRHASCSLVLSSVAVDRSEVISLTAASALDAGAAAECGEVLSTNSSVVELLTGARVELKATYAASGKAASSDSTLDATAAGWLRKVLSAASTSLRLSVTAPRGGASVELTAKSPPAASLSPELTLAVSDNELLKVLPEVEKHLGSAGQFAVTWNLDHETGSVLVNGARIERAPLRFRPAGPVDLMAVGECTKGDGSAPYLSSRLYFVEANDEGRANEDQLDAAVGAVAASGKPVIVAVFVHGWQHSAEESDDFVCGFSSLVRAVEDMEGTKPVARRREVVGVYVGWPGAAYQHEIANAATTFWNRLAVADRLGGDENAVLPRLIRGLAEAIPVDANAGAGDSSAFVVAGHSLGGRAVFNAVRNDIVSTADARGPDLVMLVNPAFSANAYAGVHARRCDLGVPLLSFSSRTDGVTRRIYPAGQTVTYPYSSDPPIAFIEHIYTAANYDGYLTHRLELQPDGTEVGTTQTISRGPGRVPLARRSELYDDVTVNVYGPPGGSADQIWYTMSLDSVGEPGCASQARVVEVDPEIVATHSDIFTPQFMEYVVRALNRSLGPRQ